MNSFSKNAFRPEAIEVIQARHDEMKTHLDSLKGDDAAVNERRAAVQLLISRLENAEYIQLKTVLESYLARFLSPDQVLTASRAISLQYFGKTVPRSADGYISVQEVVQNYVRARLEKTRLHYVSPWVTKLNRIDLT